MKFLIQSALKLSLLFFVFVAPKCMQAEHLVGGNLEYEFLRESGGDYIYLVRVRIFRDCKASATPFDGDIDVAAYYDNANASRVSTIRLFLNGEEDVEPPSGGSNCDFEPDVCIKSTVYEGTISLPSSSVGFNLIHVRCCRNDLMNLIEYSGQTYYAYIPPTQDYTPSFPKFENAPSTYVCKNDNLILDFETSTSDPDGDSLVYELYEPYHGGSELNPKPNPFFHLRGGIDRVTYKQGYSYTSPFGADGVARLNASTGAFEMSAPEAGLYTVAYQVKKYRNNELIGRVVRDLQIIVLDCGQNSPPRPRVDNSNISPNSTIKQSIYEGEELKLSLSFFDIEEDSIYLNPRGALFDSFSSTMHPAISRLEGLEEFDVDIEWTTECGMARTAPYVFEIRASDNGCPQMNALYTFEISVLPVETAPISGPDSVCEASEMVAYQSASTYDDRIFEWAVSNGSFTTSPADDDKNVGIDWMNPGWASIQVVEKSLAGCVGDTVQKDVYVSAYPIVDLNSPEEMCSGDTLDLTASAEANLIYRWELMISNEVNHQFTSQNEGNTRLTASHSADSPQEGLLTFAADRNGCIRKDSQQLTILPTPRLSNIIGPTKVCHNSSREFSAGRDGFTYFWEVAGGQIESDDQDAKTVEILWTNDTLGELTVYKENDYDCPSNVRSISVEISKPTLETIIGTPFVCPNSSDIKYFTDLIPSSDYEWFVEGSQGFQSGNDKNEILVNWGDSMDAAVRLLETNYFGCQGDTLDFPVTITYFLKTPPIEGDSVICAFAEGKMHQVYGTNGYVYDWEIGGGIFTNEQGLPQRWSDWRDEDVAWLKVVEKAYDSVNDRACIGDTSQLDIRMAPLPETNLDLDSIFCLKSPVEASAIGFEGSYFDWQISPKMPFDSQGAADISGFAPEVGFYELGVAERTIDGCQKDTLWQFFEIKPHPEAPEIEGSDVVCLGTTHEELEFRIPEKQDGSGYRWQVEGASLQGSNNEFQASLEWEDSMANTRLTFFYTSPYGCEGDTAIKDIKTDFSRPFLNFVSTLEENDEWMELDWTTQHAKDTIEAYQIFRKSTGYEQVEQIATTESSYFVDETVETDKGAYTYQIALQNQCGHDILSNPHRSIYLQNEKIGEDALSLFWTDYSGWGSGLPESYDILRRVTGRNQEEFKLYESNIVLTEATNLEVGLDGFEQCYRIYTEEGENRYSYSNVVCEKFDAYVYIPNAFTPNDDLTNDKFKVVANNLIEFRMQIYNRWGALIFETDDHEFGWDGTYDGKECPEGVYLVIVDYRGNENRERYKGNVTLIR